MEDLQKHPFKSFGFVFVQFLSLALIGLTGPVIPRVPVLLGIELAGILLGVWAVQSMRIGNFNITPDPLHGSRLVRRGPYQWIRHPMYLALLLTALPLVINHITLVRGALWLILLVNLVLKLNYEEGLLAERFPGYQEYRSETYRLIPFLY